jgi:pimeloyl-ACP methyl ester carboxylesterase
VTAQDPTAGAVRSGYAPVNGLRMYYEIHGEGDGPPLVLLHGAFMTVEAIGPLLPALAESRRVIVPEMQAHGRTGDVDRPLTYEQMADDTAALLRHLGIGQADVAGYSLGGGVAWQLAIRHPELVRKLVPISVATDTAHGVVPEYHAGLAALTPELFAGSPWKETYDRVAPDPSAFPALVEKIKGHAGAPYTWSAEEIRAIPAPTLLVFADAEGIHIAHAAELLGLRGGGVGIGDITGIPPARLAVLPGTTHLGVLARVDWLREMICEFLDAPAAEPA